ncbi:MAG: hypothetical protein QM811_00680 [Pirellulales bacterium]
MQNPYDNFPSAANSSNPYSAPQTLDRAAVAGVPMMANAAWVGDELSVPAIAALPPTCVFCNEPVQPSTYKSRALYYMNPLFYLLVLLNILIFAIVAICVRKKCQLTFGYCQTHARKRALWLTVAAVLMISAIGMFFYAANQRRGGEVAGLTGGGMFIGGLIVLVIASRTIAPKGELNGYFLIKGFGRPFIDANRR